MTSTKVQAQIQSNPSPLGQNITIRHFELLADEPSALGGEDAGPQPLELLLASLGACKAITAKMYAARKGWPLTNIDVQLSYEKEGNQHKIQAEIILEGDLDPEQRQRILEISDRCPVHRVITGDVHIQSTLLESASSRLADQ